MGIRYWMKFQTDLWSAPQIWHWQLWDIVASRKMWVWQTNFTTSFTKQPQVLSALIRLYADNDCHAKACDVYEDELQRMHQVDNGAPAQRSMLLDTHVERS